MRGPCARDEVATGGQGHLERAHDMGLVIDPVAVLLGAVGRQNKDSSVVRTGRNNGGNGWWYRKEVRARRLICAASYVHAKTPLYVFPHSSLRLRPAIYLLVSIVFNPDFRPIGRRVSSVGAISIESRVADIVKCAWLG